MRIATWNIKQIAPRRSLDERLTWLEQNVEPDIAVLTEADLKVSSVRPTWSITGKPTALAKGQNFSTFNISPRLTLHPFDSVKVKRRTHDLDTWYPGILTAADIEVEGRIWGTIIGMYAVTRDPDGTKVGSGRNSIYPILTDVDAIVASGRHNIIAAGDLNLLPVEVAELFEQIGMVDLLFQTSTHRDPLPGCTGCDLGPDCGHLWTHKNGNAEGNGVPQQLDYIFCSEDLWGSVKSVWGGINAFTDVLQYSDHAPVVADFS
jgi:exonuclease III